MNPFEFYTTTKKMREAQKRYYATPRENRDAKQQALRESKHYEQLIDAEIARVEAHQQAQKGGTE